MNPAPTPSQPAWTPPPDVTDHAGNPIPPQMDFFLPPPPEIGKILSAFSAHTTGRVASRLWMLWGPILAAVLAVIPIFVGIEIRASLTIPIIASVAFALTALFVAYYVARYNPTISYVGTTGVARCSSKGPPYQSTKAKIDLLHFPSAIELRTRYTVNIVNFAYAGDQCECTWNNSQGKKIYGIIGAHNKYNPPAPENPYFFALAAETAWSRFMFDAVALQVETHGFAHFNLKNQDWVRVGPGFFEFSIRGQTARITPAEIKSITLKDGKFSLISNDAGWFSRQGKFILFYPDIANAKLFLLTVEKLLGFKFD